MHRRCRKGSKQDLRVHVLWQQQLHMVVAPSFCLLLHCPLAERIVEALANSTNSNATLDEEKNNLGGSSSNDASSLSGLDATLANDTIAGLSALVNASLQLEALNATLSNASLALDAALANATMGLNNSLAALNSTSSLRDNITTALLGLDNLTADANTTTTGAGGASSNAAAFDSFLQVLTTLGNILSVLLLEAAADGGGAGGGDGVGQ